MSVTLLVVNYRSADLTASAIDSALRASVADLEVVVVDNSCDASEAGKLEALDPDHLIVSETNLGYAGGINRGIDICSGDLVIISNPDVVFAPGSIDRLVEELEDESVSMAGPAFFWDEELTWHLPPPETMRFSEQLMRNLARRFGIMSRRVSRARLERRLRFWRSTEVRDVDVLSGAVMAVRRKDLGALRFDEDYPLFFEEVDLMRRIRRGGGSLRHVPSARVRHIWAQSSRRNPRTEALFDQSRRRFQKRWHGLAGDAVLNLIAARGSAACESPELRDQILSLPESGDFLVELGDGREFMMAAGRFVTGGDLRLPTETLRCSPLDQLCCRVVDLADLSIVQSWTVQTSKGDGNR